MDNFGISECKSCIRGDGGGEISGQNQSVLLTTCSFQPEKEKHFMNAYTTEGLLLDINHFD